MTSRSIVFHSALYAGSAAVLRLVGFVVFTWFAHSLSVEAFGSLGMLYAVQTGVAAFASAGIFESVVGRLKEASSPEARRALAGSASSFFFLVTGPTVLVVSVPVLWFYKMDSSGAAVGSAVLSGMLLAFALLQAQIVRLDEQHVKSLHFGFSMPLLGLLTGAVAFAIWRSEDAFFCGSLAGLSVCAVVLRLNNVGSYGTERLSNVRHVVLAIAPYFVIAFFGWLSGYGNNFIIETTLTATEVARYTFVLTLSSMLQLVATALNQVWSPRFFRLHQEVSHHALDAQCARVYRLQAIALGVVSGVVVLLYPFALTVLGGNLLEYRSLTLELLLLCASYVLLVPWWHCSNYFFVENRGGELLRVVIISSAAGLTAWIALIWIYGELGVYLGFFVQMLSRALVITHAARVRWLITLPWTGVAIGLSAAACGYAVASILESKW